MNEYQKAPEVTRQRLYLEAVESVLANTNKVMIDVEGGNNLTYLPLDRIMQPRQGDGLSRNDTGPTTPSANGSSAVRSALDEANRRRGNLRGRDR